MPQDMQDSHFQSRRNYQPGTREAVLSVINPADQRILFSRILKNGLSVRESEQQASELNRGIRGQNPSSGKKEEQILRKKNPDVMDIEQQFIDALGTKVSLNGNLLKGKIEITYFSREDLERIFEIIIK